jgi:hypothetical protein
MKYFDRAPYNSRTYNCDYCTFSYGESPGYHCDACGNFDACPTCYNKFGKRYRMTRISSLLIGTSDSFGSCVNAVPWSRRSCPAYLSTDKPECTHLPANCSRSLPQPAAWRVLDTYSWPTSTWCLPAPWRSPSRSPTSTTCQYQSQLGGKSTGPIPASATRSIPASTTSQPIPRTARPVSTSTRWLSATTT